MDIDTKHTRKPVCPYCGHIENNDEWQLKVQYEDTEIDCEECGAEYKCFREVEITYSTKKIG